MKYLILSITLLFTLNACSGDKTGSNATSQATLTEQVDQLLEQDKYTEALELLESKETTDEVLLLKEKTHLNYGLFLEYRDSEVTNMRDKMNSALRQYIEVLTLNPDNEKAITEIEQILGIYATFGNRQPADDVVEDLRELGFEV